MHSAPSHEIPIPGDDAAVTAQAPARRSNGVTSGATPQFVGEVHAFRALAIFMIVAGHSIDLLSWNGDDSIIRALRIVFGNGTTLFMFVSGFLFRHLIHRFDLRRYYATKFKYVILPYLIISIPALIEFSVFVERPKAWPGTYDQPVWLRFVYFLATGTHVTPLWFIPMIAMYYAIAPILVHLDRTRWFYRMIPVFLVVSYVFPRENFYVNFMHFFSVYALGMFVNRHHSRVFQELRKVGTIIVALGLVIVMAVAEFTLTTESLTYFNLLQKLAFSAVALGVLGSLDRPERRWWVRLTADCSYGVFFVHSYVLEISERCCISYFGGLLRGNPLVLMALTIFVLATSVMVVMGIRKCLGARSRLVIGS